MDISVETVYQAQTLSHTDKPFHRVIRITDDTGTEKKTFDVIAAIEFHREFYQFRHGKRSAGKVVATAVDTIGAVIDTVIGEHYLQQGYAPPVLGKTVAYPPSSHRIAQHARLIGAHCAAGRTGNIVFGGLRKYLEFGKDVFVHNFPLYKKEASASD